ncbi:hypothetical protein Gohar_021952 [Gossypium harknessii]|uniref:Carbohydrate kinase PfkB domain-containing protein n=1 Tax=Gossypium harknessii TaxID=34285 RepID=A0A7J9IDE7_9ROSI|nr:hypothetical protein [Gossypium harknessii]
MAIERNNCSTDTLFLMLKPAIWLFLEKGVKILVLTIGLDGLFENTTSTCPSNLYSDSKVLKRSPNFLAMHFPIPPASAVRVTEAGDCLVGGMFASLSTSLDVM